MPKAQRLSRRQPELELTSRKAHANKIEASGSLYVIEPALIGRKMFRRSHVKRVVERVTFRWPGVPALPGQGYAQGGRRALMAIVWRLTPI